MQYRDLLVVAPSRLKSAKSLTRGVQVGGGYLVADLVGEGPSIVFLHAGVADRRMWRLQVAALAHEFQTIAYDLRGYGDSPPPTTTFSHVEDLVEVLKQLANGPAILVGCSLGGEIALDLTLRRPELTAALVLVSSSVGGATLPSPPVSQDFRAAIAAGNWARASVLATEHWLLGDRGLEVIDIETQTVMLAMAEAALRLEVTGRPRERPNLMRAIDHLEEIAAPTLVVAAAYDDAGIRGLADELGRRIPGARRESLPNAGHLGPLEVPSLFNRLLIRFLRELSSSRTHRA